MTPHDGHDNVGAPVAGAPEGFREALKASGSSSPTSDDVTLSSFASELSKKHVSTGMRVARVASNVSRWLITIFFATIVTCSLLIAVGNYSRQWRVVPLLSGSMSPLINTGDAVVVMPVERDDVKVGDVLAFHPPDTKDKRPTIHRVIELNEVEGKIVVQTKGDNNSVEDPWKLSLDSEQVWRIERTLPNVGWIMFEVGKPRAWCGALGLIGVTLLLSVFTDEDDEDDEENDDDAQDRRLETHVEPAEVVTSLRARKAAPSDLTAAMAIAATTTTGFGTAATPVDTSPAITDPSADA